MESPRAGSASAVGDCHTAVSLQPADFLGLAQDVATRFRCSDRHQRARISQRSYHNPLEHRDRKRRRRWRLRDPIRARPNFHRQTGNHFAVCTSVRWDPRLARSCNAANQGSARGWRGCMGVCGRLHRPGSGGRRSSYSRGRCGHREECCA